MIATFTYRSEAARIVFGAGAAGALRDEADRHKMTRLLVLCSKTRADFARRVVAPIDERIVGFCDAGGQNMPREAFEQILAAITRRMPTALSWSAAARRSDLPR